MQTRSTYTKHFRSIRLPHEYINSEQTKKFVRRLIIAGGVILPIVSTGLLLIFGIPAGHRMLPLAPEEGEVFHVHVTGHQWWWEVHYPDSNISLVRSEERRVGKERRVGRAA